MKINTSKQAALRPLFDSSLRCRNVCVIRAAFYSTHRTHSPPGVEGNTPPERCLSAEDWEGTAFLKNSQQHKRNRRKTKVLNALDCHCQKPTHATSRQPTHPRYLDHVTDEQVSLLRAKITFSNHNKSAVIVLKAGLLLKSRLLSQVILLCNCCVCFLTACIIYCINFVVFTVGTRIFCKTNTCEQTRPSDVPTAGARLKNHPVSVPFPCALFWRALLWRGWHSSLIQESQWEKSGGARATDTTHLFTPRPQANGEERHSKELSEKRREGQTSGLLGLQVESLHRGYASSSRVCAGLGLSTSGTIFKNALDKWTTYARKTYWCLMGLKHSNDQNKCVSHAYAGEDYFGLLRR